MESVVGRALKQKEKIKTIIYKILIRSGVVIPVGYIYSIMRFRRTDTLYVLIYQGIGDVIVTLGYLSSYIQKHKLKFNHICLVRIKKMEEIYAMYDCADMEMIVNKYFFHFICGYHRTQRGRDFFDKKKNILIVHTGNYIKDSWNYFYRMPNVTFMSFIKYGILELDQEAIFFVPKVKSVSDRSISQIRNNSGIGKKYVIINPYANSIMEDLPKRFWLKLIMKLRSCGYDVCMDSGGGKYKVFKGVQEIRGNLSEMFELSRNAVAYIGLRSGIMDFLLFSGAKIIALYPSSHQFDKRELFQAFDINGINQLLDKPVNLNLSQYKVNDENEVVVSILSELGKEKILL